MRTRNLLRVRVVKIVSWQRHNAILVIWPWFAWWTTHLSRCQPTDSGCCRFRYRSQLVAATCRGLTYSLEYPSRVVSRLIALLVRESVRDVSRLVLSSRSRIIIEKRCLNDRWEWSACYGLKNKYMNCIYLFLPCLFSYKSFFFTPLGIIPYTFSVIIIRQFR